MPSYTLTNPKTGTSYTVTFKEEATEKQLKEAAEKLFSGDEWTTGGMLEAGGKGLVHGMTDVGSWGYGVLGAIDRTSAEIMDAVGLDKVAAMYRARGMLADDLSREGHTFSKGAKKKLREELPRHQFAAQVGEGAATLLPLLPAGAAAGAAGLGTLGSGLVVGGAAGAVSGAAELQEQRLHRLRELEKTHPNLSKEDAEMIAIGQATPWSLLAGATTMGTTMLGGRIGQRFLGGGGLEALGAGGRAAGRAATGRFATQVPWILGEGVGRGATRIGLQAGLEGVEEGIDETLQAYIVERMSRDPDITFSEAMRRGMDAAAVGAVLGGTLGGVGTKQARESAKQRAESNLASMREVFEASSSRLTQKLNVDLEKRAKESPDKTNKQLLTELRASILGADVDTTSRTGVLGEVVSPASTFMSWLETGKPKGEGRPPMVGEWPSSSEITDTIMDAGTAPPPITSHVGSLGLKGESTWSAAGGTIYSQDSEGNIWKRWAGNEEADWEKVPPSEVKEAAAAFVRDRLGKLSEPEGETTIIPAPARQGAYARHKARPKVAEEFRESALPVRPPESTEAEIERVAKEESKEMEPDVLEGGGLRPTPLRTSNQIFPIGRPARKRKADREAAAVQPAEFTSPEAVAETMPPISQPDPVSKEAGVIANRRKMERARKRKLTEPKASDLSFLAGPETLGKILTTREQAALKREEKGRIVKDRSERRLRDKAEKKLSYKLRERLKRRRKLKKGKIYGGLSAIEGIADASINTAIDAALTAARAAEGAGAAADIATASLEAAMQSLAKTSPKAFTALGPDEIRERISDELIKSASPVAFQELVHYAVVSGVPFEITHTEYEATAGQVIWDEVYKASLKSDLPIDVDHEVEVLTQNGWTELLRDSSRESFDLSKELDMPRGVWDEKGIEEVKEELAELYAGRQLSSFHNNIEFYTYNRDQEYEDTILEHVYPRDAKTNRELFDSDEEWEKAVMEATDFYHFGDPSDKAYELHPLRGATVKVESESSKNWDANPMFTHTTAYGNIDSIMEAGLRATHQSSGGLRGEGFPEFFFVAPVDFKTYWGSDGVGSVTRWIVSETQGIDMAKGKKVALGWKKEAMDKFSPRVPFGAYAKPDDLMSHWNEEWSGEGSSMENPSRYIEENGEYYSAGGRPVRIAPEDLFVWDGKDWKPLEVYSNKLRSDRMRNVLKKWRDKVRSLREKMGDSLYSRIDLGLLNLPPALVEASLTVAIKSIDAGVSLSDSLSRAYRFLKRPDVSESEYNNYMISRMDESFKQMDKGSSLRSAVKASGLPLGGKIYPQIQEEEAREAKLPASPTDVKDFRSWTRYLKRFFVGTSDVTASNGALLALSSRMDAHVDYADKYSGMLSNMLLESGSLPAMSFIETEGLWGTWMDKPTEEAAVAEEEFERYQRANHDGDLNLILRDYENFSPMGRNLIEGWKNVAKTTGKMMKDENIIVKYPDGTKRPFIMIGERFWPRALKPEYSAALNSLDDSSEMTQTLEDIGNALKKSGEIKSVSVDSIRKWWTAITGVPMSGDAFAGYAQQDAFMASIDRARTRQRMPVELMDFSLNAARRYIFNWSERFAQIKAFGQKARDGKDLFEIVGGRLKESGFTKDELRYVESLRKAAYGITESDLSWAERRLMFLNKTATLTMLTGGFNAVRNMTGMGPTSAIYGYKNSMKALWQMRDYAASAKQARSWGVLRDDLALMLAGHDLAIEGRGYIERADKSLTGWTKKGLRMSGFSQSENFVRTHAALTSSAFVSEGVGAVKNLNNAGLAQEFKDMSERLGVDWRKIVSEDSSQGRETSKFIRKAVKEVQGGYRYNQLPAWMSTPTGKFMFKFGAYGMQITRMINRNVLKPALKGNLMPLLKLIATAAGSGEMLYFLREYLFGKVRPDATLHEIFKGEDRAYNLFMRLLNDVTYAGTFGIVGDMAGLVKNVATQQRVKSPFDPAGLQIIENVGWFLIDRFNEGTLHNPLEWRLGLHRMMESQASAYRYGRAGLMHLASIGGSEWDMVLKERAVQDQRFLRNSTRRFQEAVGDDVKNKVGEGRYTPSPYARFYDKVKYSLSIGDVRAAKEAAIEFSEQLPEEDKGDAWRRLSSSILRSQPMKVGDSTSKEIKEDFINWAKRNLSEKEVARIMKVQQTYVDTAINAGLIGQSPRKLSRPMKTIMNGKPPRSRGRSTVAPHPWRHGTDGEAEKFLRKRDREMESVFGY